MNGMCDHPEEVRATLVELEEHYENFDENNRGANGYLFFAKNRVSQQEVAIKFYCVVTYATESKI